MTTSRRDLLEKLGEKMARENADCQDPEFTSPPAFYAGYEAGFLAALDLLMPVVERLEYCAIDPHL